MTQTALTYGKALFDLAQEEGKVRQYMDELRVIRQVLADDPAFLELLASRAIARQQRLQVLDTCFRDKIQPYLLSFMKILCENDTIRQLPGCIRQFELCYNDHCGIAEVKAVSAVELSSAQQKKLQRKLEEITGKTISLVFTVDPGVLGGIRLELDGRELDGTVSRRLDEIAKNLKDLTL